eukprot:tig00001003_g6271.t1
MPGASSSDAGTWAFLIEEYEHNIRDPDCAAAVAAIKALTLAIKKSTASTLHGLNQDLSIASKVLGDRCKYSISLAAATELFSKYITRTTLNAPDFQECKGKLIERGEKFADLSLRSRSRIAELGDRFIREGAVILTHGYSRVVIATLLNAAQHNKQFSVYVTETRPYPRGQETAERLARAGVPVNVVPDAAVAYFMNKIDCVIVGAEGVVENGGVINKVGTLQIAMIAHAFKKPFYVAAESYKFARLFPLGQSDLQQPPEEESAIRADYPGLDPSIKVEGPSLDYTPPNFITLLFTDLGVLTPSAVSDELIKLYQ